MTNLEILLIAIIWLAYGVYAAFRSERVTYDQDSTMAMYCCYIMFSPMVFICKCLYGAFKEYKQPMKPKPLKSIILPNADWTVKKQDIDQEAVKEIHRLSEGAEQRKFVDPKDMEIIINPYRRYGR
jgi:hypothetical protein